MKILVVGSGGREHALAWKLAQSKRVTHVWVAPGNGGTASEPQLENVAIDVCDIDKLLQFAQQQQVDLTVIGPEAPLVAGVVDAFTEAGLKCFGPHKFAAQLEGSKAFAKDFFAKYNIPTAAYGVFTDADEAKRFLESQRYPIVIKADGLAAGKGVIIAEDQTHAHQTIDDMLKGNAFGEAGHRVVIEEFLQGEEASFICMVDGKNALALATSQDHKARDNGDKGPNTGGMGAYSPAPVVTNDIHDRVMNEVIAPTIAGMAAEGCPYVGFLYAGLMIDAQGQIKVLEFNCRFGDPETQPIMMRLQSDFSELIEAALNQRLDHVTADWDPRTALGVVMAAGGYPSSYAKGDPIEGIDKANSGDTKVFHAGTVIKDGTLQTNGGRVLCVVSLADTVSEAQKRAYSGCGHIQWSNAYYRTDIGYRAVALEI